MDLPFRRAVSAALLILFCILLCASMSGCGVGEECSSSTASYADEAPTEAYVEENATETGSDSVQLGQPNEDGQRKIVYTTDLTLESKTYNDTLSSLMAALTEANGYVESSYLGGSEEAGDRWSQYTLRVPADHYSSFLAGAEASGNLVSKSETTSDITAQYVDVEARLDALNTQLTRLNELAAQAEELNDLLAIEERISDVQYQIESYTAQQRAMDDQVTYCTVTVYLNEVATLTYNSPSFAQRLMQSFGDGWDGFVAALQGAVLGLVALWPFLILLLLAAAVYLIWRRKHPRKPKPAVESNSDNSTHS